MTTPFQRHKAEAERQQAIAAQQRQLASNAPAKPQPDPTNYGEFEVLKGSLQQDVTALANLPSGADKVARKGELGQKYLSHVQAYLDGGSVYANPVLVQVVIWLFDAGRIDQALPLAFTAIEQAQVMPDQFNRNLATFVADSVLAWAEAELKADHGIEPYFTSVETALHSWPVPDVVKLKYAKQRGLIAFDAKDYQEAVLQFQRAEALEATANGTKAQVKTKLAEAQKHLAAQQPKTD